MSFALLFALAGAALTAAVQLMLKQMSRSDKTDTLLAWNLILTVPIALAPAMAVWTPPGRRDRAAGNPGMPSARSI